jgi:hypothetical protein
MIIADNRMAAGTAEPFTSALLQVCPHALGRLVIACAGEEDVPAPAGEQRVLRVTKPFNPRDLRSLAQQIFQ